MPRGFLPPGRYEQFIERLSEARKDLCSRLSPEELRQMTAAACSARWRGHILPTQEEKRQRQKEYERRYRQLARL